MKRIALAAIAALMLVGSCATTAQSQGHRHFTPLPSRCSIQSFRPFSAQVWDVGRWARGAPKHAVFKAEKRRLACAPPNHRVAMIHVWRTDKAAFNDHRRNEMFRERWTPYYGCTTAYPGITLCANSAIDIYIVQCESGGDYTPEIPGGLNFGGKYGLLDQTYHEYGGRFGHADEGPPHEQDRIARELYKDRGYAPWACA